MHKYTGACTRIKRLVWHNEVANELKVIKREGMN